MKLEATKEEIRERFRLAGEIWMLCCELCDGDCRTDIEDFTLDFDDMYEEYHDACGEELETMRVDMGDDIKGRCWFNGVSFDYSSELSIEFIEEKKGLGTMRCSLPAIYTPAQTLEAVRQLLEKYVDATSVPPASMRHREGD